jgi:hypothetical protein
MSSTLQSTPEKASRTKEFLRSRLPAFAAIAVLAALLGWGKHHFGHLFQMWLALRIPAISPTFADTRTITHSIDCLLSGRNPYIDRSFDPWLRLYNYPPIWLDLRYLGIRSSSTGWLATLFALSGLSACVAMFRARTRTAGALIFFAMLCWPLLFAIERGNTDLVLFALLVFGALAIEPERARSTSVLRGALIVLLTILKIYPIAAVVALIRNRRAVFSAALTAVVAVAALVLTCGHDLRYVLANTPQEISKSFGSFSFLMVVGRHLTSGFRQTIATHETLASVFGVAVGAAALVMGACWRIALQRALPVPDVKAARGFLAFSGLAIYCLAFVRGSSFDYRLIFLLAPLMYLIEDLNRKQSRRALPAALVLLALLWSPYLTHELVQEVLDLVVFAGASAWLGAALMTHLEPEKAGARFRA